MKPMEKLEIGALRTFRQLTAVQLAFSALTVAAQRLVQSSSASGSAMLSAVSLIAPGLLLVYLSMPSLQRPLKTLYMPIGLAWATLGPIVDPYLPGNLVLSTSADWVWRQVLLLFIPLIVLTLQYSRQTLVWYCLSVALLNLALMSRALGMQAVITNPLLAVLVIQLVVYLLLGNMIVGLVQVQREQWQRLTEANQQLAQHASTLEQLAISRERNRMARELHDTVAHTLSGLAIQLEGARSVAQLDPRKSVAMLDRAIAATRSGLTEARKAIQSLRATPLEDLGVDLAIHELAHAASERAGFALQFEKFGENWDLPAELEQCMYRIAQEALENIVRHARAGNVHVCLNREAHRIRLTIQDDGVGFDPAAAEQQDRYGIRGMRERAELVGGRLSVQSMRNQGTTIGLELEQHD